MCRCADSMRDGLRLDLCKTQDTGQIPQEEAGEDCSLPTTGMLEMLVGGTLHVHSNLSGDGGRRYIQIINDELQSSIGCWENR